MELRGTDTVARGIAERGVATLGRGADDARVSENARGASENARGDGIGTGVADETLSLVEGGERTSLLTELPDTSASLGMYSIGTEG